MKKYNFLIVGSGLFGSSRARELSNKGYNILNIEKREHIGGNIFTKKMFGINVHLYGAHIFHTSNKKIRDYVNFLLYLITLLTSQLLTTITNNFISLLI